MSDLAPRYDGLFNGIVRRLRTADTIFRDHIKLVLRQLANEQYALLKLPYLLVVPTVTRTEGGRSVSSDFDSIINPRTVTFLAQFDGRGSEADWRAGIDIEIAERQLIGVLVNWRPAPWFRPTGYGGMRIEATRAPDVKAAFIFTFFEEVFLAPDLDPELCRELETPMLFPEFIVSRGDPCAPVEQLPHDPCEDPCVPCLPDRTWFATDWFPDDQTRR